MNKPMKTTGLFFLFLMAICAYGQEVTFSVDMRKAPVQGGSVGLRGSVSPLSWDSSLPLMDTDGDGIFSVQVTFAPDLSLPIVEYKFLVNDTLWELGAENRILSLKHPERKPLTELWNQNNGFSPADLPLLSAADLHSDLDLLRQAFALHPGVYRFRSRAAVDSAFAATRQQFNQPHTWAQAWLAFSRLTAFIQCGHTFLNPLNQPGFVQQLLLNTPDKLPFIFSVAEGRMVITHNAVDHPGVAAGTEVLAIGGRPVPEILTGILPFMKADGGNDAHRLARMQLNGYEPYEPFDLFFPLIFPPQNGQYQLTLRDPDGQITETAVPVMAQSDRYQRLRARGVTLPGSYDALWSFEVLDGQTAVMRFLTFSTFNFTFEWKDFIDRAFEEMKEKGILNLIVDIRGNEGGDDLVLYVLGKNLARKPLVTPPATDRLAYEVVPAELQPYCFSWTDDYKDYRGKVVPTPDGAFTWKKPTPPMKIRGSKKAFGGDLYVLVDAANSSATFYMAQILQYNDLGTLIGQTTGGSQRGLNGGQMIFFRMPHTGLEVDIPIFGTVYEGKPDGGITPDVPVTRTVKDLQAGRDPEMARALELIGEKIK